MLMLLCKFSLLTKQLLMIMFLNVSVSQVGQGAIWAKRLRKTGGGLAISVVRDLLNPCSNMVGRPCF